MVGYLDSSVLLRHILLGDSAIKHVLACERIISSELLEIECRRVLHRYRMEGDLDDAGFITARRRLDDILSGISLLALSVSVKKMSMEPFPVSVKTLDSLHLASALIYSEVKPDEKLLIFSFDKTLNRCGQALGFSAPFAQKPE
jgi:predicted nucleic acid-binding protein